MVQKILVKNAHVMGYDHLSEACHALIEKMASYGVAVDEIDSTTYKYAGLTQSNKDTLIASINRRMDFIRDDEKKAHYAKLASLVEGMDFNRANLVKVASTLESLDTALDMRRLYDKHLLNPMDSVFNTNAVFNTKVANELFTADMAHRVSPDQIKHLLGEDVLSESSMGNDLDRNRLLDVVNSLPNDMVKDFVSRI
jgi:hypothetical protein